MRSRLRLWPGFPFRRITSAWGVALTSRAVSLVSLVQISPQTVRVQQAMHLSPPSQAHESDRPHDWLVQALGEVSDHEVRRHRRLVVALSGDSCRSGRLTVPVAWGPDALMAEVQLGAAESLNVTVADVSFDYEVQDSGSADLQCVHWLACLRSEAQAWYAHTRAAGWHMPAMEHQAQAARRAFQAMQGGLHALQTRAHQDWQFHWPPAGSAEPDEALDQALQPLQHTPAWAWLCACGAGLRALS